MAGTNYVLTNLGRLRGLGALPAYPPSSLLQAGKSWYRYLVSPDVQWTSCPPNPPYGCTMYGGYAWGQWPGSEFGFAYITPTTQTSTGTPATETPEQQYTRECSESLWDWYNATPEAKCLTVTEQLQLLSWCVAWRLGNMPEYGSEKAALVTAACGRDTCEQLYAQWAAAFPAEAACFSDRQRSKTISYCRKGLSGEITAAEADAQIKEIIANATADCITTPTPTSPTPTPTATPTEPEAGTPGGGLPPEAPDMFEPTFEAADDAVAIPPDVIYDDTGLYPPLPSPGPTSEGGLLRQLGPIVGIGLVVAVGLTLARSKKKSKLTKRGKRK